MTWTSGLDPGLRGDIYERRFSAAGTPTSGVEVVQTRTNPNTSSDQRNQSVAIDDAGNHVVVWQDDGRTSNTSVGNLDVAMRRYAATGTPLGDEERVNTTLDGSQGDPAIAMNAAGAFTVVWRGDGPQGYGVYLQHYAATGARRGGEVRVNASAVDSQCQPEVVLGARGDAVVAWIRPDGQVLLRRIDRDGAAASGEVVVGTTPAVVDSQIQQNLSLASNEAGALVVAWTGRGPDYGVFAQRFTLAPVAGEATPAAPAAVSVSVVPVPAGSSGASVRYTLAEAGAARVVVVDALGRTVAVLAEGAAGAGAHDVRLETAGLAAGVYVVRVEAGGRVAVARVPVVR